MASFVLGFLYSVPAVAVMYLAMLVLDGIVASPTWQRDWDGATIPFLLGAVWFVNSVGTAWLLTWILVKAMDKIERLLGFVIDDRLFWPGVVAGIVVVGSALYFRYRRAKR